MKWPRADSPNLVLALPFMAIIPWFFIQMNTALKTNHAWLMVAAGRFLDGGRMADNFVETNPPLSILLYVPAALLTRLAGVPPWLSPYIMGGIFLILSVAAVVCVLRYADIFTENQRIVFLSAFLMANTYLVTNFFFADRDHIVVMGLVPFLLAQVCILKGKEAPRSLLLPVLYLGAAAILLKPHYGIFPALMIVWRAVRRRDVVSVLREQDFISLAVAALLYLAAAVLLFPDYIPEIFPLFKAYYLGQTNAVAVTYWALVFVVIVAIAVVASLIDLPPQETGVAWLLLLAGALSSGLYLLQMKGFFYHLIPSLVFSYCAVGLLVLAAVRRWLITGPAGLLLSVVLIVAAAMFYSPPSTKAMTHEDYRQTPLMGLVRGCAPGCSFFVFTENMEMIHQVSIYSGAVHASRYPLLLWLRPMVDAGIGPRDPRMTPYIKDVVQDIGRYRPEVMAFVTNLSMGAYERFDLVSFFSENTDFAQEMRNYRKVGPLADNRANYFRGRALEYDFPLVYDVYVRRQ